MKLGSGIASVDSASVHEQLKTQASEALRSRELLQMLSKRQLSPHVLPAQMADWVHDPAVELQFQAQLASEWQDIQARLVKLDAEVARRQAEIATVQQSIANA